MWQAHQQPRSHVPLVLDWGVSVPTAICSRGLWGEGKESCWLFFRWKEERKSKCWGQMLLWAGSLGNSATHRHLAKGVNLCEEPNLKPTSLHSKNLSTLPWSIPATPKLFVYIFSGFTKTQKAQHLARHTIPPRKASSQSLLTPQHLTQSLAHSRQCTTELR